VVGVKRRCSGQREDGMHLSRADYSWMVVGNHDLVFQLAFVSFVTLSTSCSARR
jgi:hypothetical protein